MRTETEFFEPDVYIHDTAIVDNGATIGAGTRIWHFSHVMSGAQVGEECTLGQNVFVAGTAKIGDHVKIQNNVSVYDGVTLADYAFCGPSVVFTNVMTPRSAFPRQREAYAKTSVGTGTSIGANATIVCGTTIGDWALVGAGAVVSNNVPSHALVLGVPARQVGWVCHCGSRLEQRGDTLLGIGQKLFECRRCGNQYIEDDACLALKHKEGVGL